VSLAALAYKPIHENLSKEALRLLDSYADLLFNEAMPSGFIGDCGRNDIDTRHIFDAVLPAISDESKAAFPLWQSEKLNVFDLGAGSGIPSIPLAILFPQHTFHLIDAQEKRCTFALNAAQKLGLLNVKIYHGVVQDFPKKYGTDKKADIVIFRAFRKVLASLELALYILAERKEGNQTPKLLYWRSQMVPFTDVGFKRLEDLGLSIESFVKFTSAENILPRGLYTFAKVNPPQKGFPRSWKKISADKLIEKEA